MDGDRPICHIIRGLPGAGKSTRAARLGCLAISPQDMYATRAGVYRFREGQDRREHRDPRPRHCSRRGHHRRLRADAGRQ